MGFEGTIMQWKKKKKERGNGGGGNYRRDEW